jgi:hypothetical protein
MAGPAPIHPLVKAFVEALRNLGYVEGHNLVVERRSAEGRFERFGKILAELVGGKVDVIVTAGDAMALEAKRVTNIVPIVMATSFDPVGAGIVANITEFTFTARCQPLVYGPNPEASWADVRASAENDRDCAVAKSIESASRGSSTGNATWRWPLSTTPYLEVAEVI